MWPWTLFLAVIRKVLALPRGPVLSKRESSLSDHCKPCQSSLAWLWACSLSLSTFLWLRWWLSLSSFQHRLNHTSKHSIIVKYLQLCLRLVAACKPRAFIYIYSLCLRERSNIKAVKNTQKVIFNSHSCCSHMIHMTFLEHKKRHLNVYVGQFFLALQWMGTDAFMLQIEHTNTINIIK